MKKFTIVICLILLAACRKQEPEHDPYKLYIGQASVLNNGEVWEPRVAAVYDNTDTKSRFSLIFEDIETSSDRLSIENIISEVGTTELEDYETWRNATDPEIKRKTFAKYNGSFGEGEDVFNRNFTGTLVPPLLTISICDTINHVVKGTFEVGFWKAKAGPNGHDTVIFRQGKFRAKINSYTEFYYPK